ncbi:hypothetical protein, partial ['Camptotheca acuminata' phytoplasma]|uniref:hypothetical protein n=1 Tax='Camptotheca acuminata' phytoplasma TaxID=3239192 RepID=UPI00351A8225
LRRIQSKEYLKWLRKFRADPEMRDKSKYCVFHKDHDHTTDNCWTLKQKLECHIRKGRLQEYVLKDEKFGDRMERQPPRGS